MSKPWTIWSWDQQHSTWLQVAEGTKREMSATLDRKRAAAARLLPDARFALAGPGEVPSGPPEQEDAAAERRTAEHAVEARWTAIGDRLGALGLDPGRGRTSGQVYLDPDGWERLLGMQEAGLILRGLPAHVRFAHPDAGYDGDRARSAERLTPGRVYVLREYHVGHSHSTVELDGFPDFRFNAVQFEPATHQEYEGQDEPA